MGQSVEKKIAMYKAYGLSNERISKLLAKDNLIGIARDAFYCFAHNIGKPRK